MQLCLVLGGALPAWAVGVEGAACQSAVAAAEASAHLPEAFLAAIARVETGRPDPGTGLIIAWPWAVNAEGTGSFYATKTEAVTAVRALQARGVRSIDVGCLQVNLQQHPDAFPTLEQAFDPFANAAYAAGFLRELFDRTGSWPLAAAAYHSMTPGIGSAYQQRVLAEWAVPQNDARAPRHARAVRTPAPSPRPAEVAESRLPHPPPVIAASSVTASPIGHSASQSAAQFPLARPPGVVGRSLAAYRLMPTRLAFRLPG